MRIDFRQGIITYPTSGTIQQFLTYSGGYVSLSCANGKTDVAFAHSTENYLISETVDVDNAWGIIPIGSDVWIYWDLNLRTGVRTFGYTAVQPITSPTQPTVVEDQHWFNTSNTTMYVCTAGTYRAVARVFAAKVRDGVFTALGYGVTNKPFAGSQVGIQSQGTRIGQLIFDDTGSPVRRVDGRLFTTENELFVDGAPINVIKLDSAFVSAAADSNLPKFHVVKFTDFGTIGLAAYSDVSDSTIAMLTEDLSIYQTGGVVMQGCITNPDWNWPTLSNLWVSINGELTSTDPHVSDPLTNLTPKPPVARVVGSDTIIFDQGLGGLTAPVYIGSAVEPATPTVAGVAKLSVAAVDAADPIMVGTNDPRMANARVPLAHTQAATTVIPTAYGSLTGANLQTVLQQIEDGKVAKSGSTMTGLLTLSGSPTTANHAATKAYVDAIDLSSRVAKAGDTMTGLLTLSGNPTNANHAATKAYVDALAQGLAVKPAVKVATTTNLVGIYSNGTNGVNGTLTLPPALTLNIDGNITWSLTDGILVKNQVNAFENGRYYLSQVGNETIDWILTRCGYCDEAHEIPSSYVFVQAGDTLMGTGWVALVGTALGDPLLFEVGIDAINFTQFSGGGGGAPNLISQLNASLTITDTGVGTGQLRLVFDGEQIALIDSSSLTVQGPPIATEWIQYPLLSTSYPRSGNVGNAVDSLGNVIIVDGLYDSVNVSKISPTGAEVWSTNISGSATTGISGGIAVDAADNIYFLINDPYNTAVGGIVVKLSPTGSIVWSTSVDNGGSGQPMLSSIAVDSAGNVIVSGWLDAGSSPLREYIAKLDASGTSLWAITSPVDPADSNYTHLLAVDGVDIYAVSTLGLGVNYGIHTMKLNGSGVVQWQQQLNTQAAQTFNNRVTDVTVAGGFMYFGSVDVEPGTRIYQNFIFKISTTDGSVVWTAKVASSKGPLNACTVDPLTDVTYWSVGSAEIDSIASAADLSVCAIDSSGSVVMGSTIVAATPFVNGDTWNAYHDSLNYRDGWLSLSWNTSGPSYPGNEVHIAHMNINSVMTGSVTIDPPFKLINFYPTTTLTTPIVGVSSSVWSNL